MENVNYNELFHRALADPSAVDSDTLSALIDHFPYAQSLRIAQARRNYPSTGTYTGDALLVTGLPLWLYGYTVTSFQPTEQNAAPADDATMEAAGAAEQPAHGTVADETGDAVTGTRGTEHEETRTGAIHIETVIPDVDDSGMAEHPAAMDYFTYEEQMVDDASASTEVNEGSQNMVPAGNATPHEKVSLYNDEHMPYSFLWWLNKTRKEHAATYRPYAPEVDAAAYPGAGQAPQDEQVLDHQIRENIFHLQSPEEKLSDGRSAETVPFQVPKKTDPIIERFIREEPQIKPPQADKINLENKARKSAEDQLTLVTETLATIYEEQGLYPKAIAIYKKLSLKYPEKSAYFAARITALTNKLP